MTDSETTGTDLLRQALYARSRKMNIAGLAKDMGLPANDLEEFCRGRSDLPVETKQKLVNFHWNGSAVFDADHDALRPADRTPPRTLGLRPTWSAPVWKPPVAARPAPQPVEKTKPVPKTRRAGWIE